MKSDLKHRFAAAAMASALLLAQQTAGTATERESGSVPALKIVGEATLFLPGIASTKFSDIRLTLSPDGKTAMWFSRDRPGGAGGYDIWISRRSAKGWAPATPASFNSALRDFDPAFSSDGRYVYFCSDRPGGLGGGDLYRVAVTADGFGSVEHLGSAVNSAGNEFAPMLSPDRTLLLFSSDRPGGAGRHDLYTSRQRAEQGFEPAQRLPGEINTPADEFDASFLSDGSTLVFARAQDFRTDRVDLFFASSHDGRYDAGIVLPQTVNSGDQNTYGPMLDWSQPDRFSVSGRREGATGMDLYLVRYVLEHEPSH